MEVAASNQGDYSSSRAQETENAPDVVQKWQSRAAGIEQECFELVAGDSQRQQERLLIGSVGNSLDATNALELVYGLQLVLQSTLHFRDVKRACLHLNCPLQRDLIR